jgi:hypothetical protein
MNMSNVNNHRGRRAPVIRQYIDKNITEEVITGPAQQFGYPINGDGKLKKTVNTGNGKGEFSHNLTLRQINSNVAKGKPITYKRTYTMSVLNPRWVAAEHRREVNNLGGLFGSIQMTNRANMANGGRHHSKRHHSKRHHSKRHHSKRHNKKRLTRKRN